MTNLREQMLKAGLITEAQAAPSEPERGPEGGGRGGRRRRGGRGGRGGGGGGERGVRGPVTGADAGPPASPEAQAEAAALAASDRIELKPQRGGRRWYYVSREGLVPFLEVAEDVAEQLGRGDLALVEAPGGETWAVRRETARRLVGLDRAWLRTFNG